MRAEYNLLSGAFDRDGISRRDLRDAKMDNFALPVTRYALSGDVSIAYQVMGDGPIDLVMVPGARRTAIEQVDIQGLLEWRGRVIAGAFGSSG